MRTIETLDVQSFTKGDARARAQFVIELGRAFQDVGFVIIKNHPIGAEQQQDVYQKIAEFFALPNDAKRKYEFHGSGGARGYTSFGKEHAKDSKVGDLKEFFHYGMDLPEGHTLNEEYLPNPIVTEIAGFNHSLKRLYKDLLLLGSDLLRAIALYLELPENYFDSYIQYGNSILRPIHYPPLTGQEVPSAIRSAAHEDINLITLLIGASAPGLQVKHLSGDWIDATTQPGEIVVNVGDMLQRLTNYRLVSTTHRVVNPPLERASTTRFSVPFFLHPESRMSLKALPSCVGPDKPQRDPSTTAGEYLSQRLKEIGLT
jgi:isopenicillin N synthase-like dioxygenase